MYNDKSEDSVHRINERILLVEAYFDKGLSDSILNLKKKKFPAIPWAPKFNWHTWHRKCVELYLVRRLSSLARARKNRLMNEDQQAAHDRILIRLKYFLPELLSLGVKVPAVVLSQIRDMTTL